MKRGLLFLLFAVGIAPSSFAQKGEGTDHIQIGAYADYFHLSQTDTDFAGLGGRVGFTAYKNLKLEAEMSYDFNKVFTEGFTDNSTVPPTVSIARSNIRALHGMFGPKLELGHYSFHPFITVKGGGNTFFFDNRPATVGTFASTVDNLRTRNINAVLYPGGGLEGYIGPIGLRLDVGDEIYFGGGTHHNLRVAFGPYIRF
ncbi:MAG TPA: hypothetical protein VN025_12090 [Candidatus Dormibacteraeota bacterium]|jgi:hypothetical protein|nr:hypothetical protein [Candidatus Dormibacteraeota bacterium]